MKKKDYNQYELNFNIKKNILKIFEHIIICYANTKDKFYIMKLYEKLCKLLKLVESLFIIFLC